MTKTDTLASKTTLKASAHGLFVELYSLIVWLLILGGGMVTVGSFFVPRLTMAEMVSGVLVGIVTIGFGLGATRFLSRDIRQTAPVFWF